MARLDRIASKLRALTGEPGPQGLGPTAAVAAILRELPGAEGAELFFIKRADRPNDPWSGHIAFPGGRRDPSDDSLLSTVIRETREEVGLELSREHLLARLPDVPATLRSKRGALVVTPFVFALPTNVPVFANEEVAATMWVSFAKLMRGEGKAMFDLEIDGTVWKMPCLHFEPGGDRLWGLTYRMLEMLIEAVQR